MSGRTVSKTRQRSTGAMIVPFTRQKTGRQAGRHRWTMSAMTDGRSWRRRRLVTVAPFAYPGFHRLAWRHENDDFVGESRTGEAEGMTVDDAAAKMVQATNYRRRCGFSWSSWEYQYEGI